MPVEEKTSRNAQIIEDRRLGRKSLEQLAAEHKITRERVRQICMRAGISNKAASRTYAANKHARRIEAAEEKSSFIMMLYGAGKKVSEIAESVGESQRVVQEIINKHMTDAIVAVRSQSIYGDTSHDEAPRDDRFWTEERCLAVVVDIAKKNGGTLVSSIEYEKMAIDNESLPSFTTIRNRLGRWSQIRVKVNSALKN